MSIWNDSEKRNDPRTRFYVTPARVLWQSDDENSSVENAQALLEERDGQATLIAGRACVLRNNGAPASILLDFGKELHGGIQIVAWYSKKETETTERTVTLRIRFGESAMEAMSELGAHGTATNDHSVRDHIIQASGFLGSTEIGNTGFRFVRIDLLDDNTVLELKTIRAVFLLRDIEYKGSFRCSDPLLEQIWETGAYTVHLNMQDYLWDGIKRDRLVWVGDLHPEISTLQRVFGFHEIVPRSLDLIRGETPLPGWMNGIPSYSMWWLLIQHDWYLHHGDWTYLSGQKAYLTGLLDLLISHIADDGTNTLPTPFIDWPTSPNRAGVQAGVHALLTKAMEVGARLCGLLNENGLAERCRFAEAKLRKLVPDPSNSKQAAALLVLAGILDAEETNRNLLSVEGSRGLSTFLGYYVLQARSEAGDIQGALDCIREYWGGMLQLGATTFWEDFDLGWLDNASRIDELTPPGKVDVHGQYGGYCYIGYRHSLCHGWASGPTAWLAEYVLGIGILEAGCKVIELKPRLGDLDWAEGTFPTPYGILHVRHEKRRDGTVRTSYRAPSEIEVRLS